MGSIVDSGCTRVNALGGSKASKEKRDPARLLDCQDRFTTLNYREQAPQAGYGA
jgi:hypothetical protein